MRLNEDHHAFRDSVRRLGTSVEVIRPQIHLPIFTATRLTFNEALRWRDFSAGATIGIDADGYAQPADFLERRLFRREQRVLVEATFGLEPDVRVDGQFTRDVTKGPCHHRYGADPTVQ
jgi:hypothetical protein